MSKDIFLPSGVNYSSIVWHDYTTAMGDRVTQGYVEIGSTISTITITHPSDPNPLDARFEFGMKTGVGSPLTHPIRALFARLAGVWPSGNLKTFQANGGWRIGPVSTYYPLLITTLINEGLDAYRKAASSTVPILSEQWGDSIRLSHEPTSGVLKRAVCRCDIKDLLSTGHNSSCPERR